jgi:diadenosine tetraphosphate (Ap4A) HIT family hydrolase
MPLRWYFYFMSGVEVRESLPELEIQDDCRFCEIAQGQEESLFDRSQSLGDGTTYLVPALGMMMTGYFLAVTKEHVTSFAQLSKDQLTTVDKTLIATEKYLTERLPGRYMRVEHGSDQPDNSETGEENSVVCGAGGCIDHAHQHLIPADHDVGEHILDLLPWQKLDRYENIAEFHGAPYIYLGRLGTHYAVANPQLPGQWIRRQIVKVRGPAFLENVSQRAYDDEIGDDGDWSLHPGIGPLTVTMVMLRAVPMSDEYGGAGLMRLGMDNPDFRPSKDYKRPPGTRDWIQE